MSKFDSQIHVFMILVNKKKNMYSDKLMSRKLRKLSFQTQINHCKIKWFESITSK